MDSHGFATRSLQAAGGLLILLGLLHIAATPHIPQLLHRSPVDVYERALGPMLLNHVLVGILLVPLGFTTWLAAAASRRGETWAVRVLMVNTIAVFALPVTLAIFMRRAEYYTAPFFLSGVLLAVLIFLVMAAATVTVIRRQYRRGRLK